MSIFQNEMQLENDRLRSKLDEVTEQLKKNNRELENLKVKNESQCSTLAQSDFSVLNAITGAKRISERELNYDVIGELKMDLVPLAREKLKSNEEINKERELNIKGNGKGLVKLGCVRVTKDLKVLNCDRALDFETGLALCPQAIRCSGNEVLNEMKLEDMGLKEIKELEEYQDFKKKEVFNDEKVEVGLVKFEEKVKEKSRRVGCVKENILGVNEKRVKINSTRGVACKYKCGLKIINQNVHACSLKRYFNLRLFNECICNNYKTCFIDKAKHDLTCSSYSGPMRVCDYCMKKVKINIPTDLERVMIEGVEKYMSKSLEIITDSSSDLNMRCELYAHNCVILSESQKKKDKALSKKYFKVRNSILVRKRSKAFEMIYASSNNKSQCIYCFESIRKKFYTHHKEICQFRKIAKMREEYNKVINKSTGELTKLDVDALTTIPRLLKLLLKMSEILSKKVKIDTVEKRHKDLSKLNKEYICEYERFNKDVMLGKFERKYKVIRRERREEGINIVNEMKFLRYLSVFFNSRMSSRVVTDNGFEEYLLRIKVKDGSLFDYLKTSNSSLSLEVRMNCLKKEKEDIMYLKNEYDSIFVLNSDNNMCILNLEKMLRSMVGNKEILEDIDERLKGKYEKRLKFEGELEKLGSSALNVLKIEEKIRNISKLKDILNYDCSGMADVLEEKTIKKEENGYIKDFSTEGYLRRKRACFGKMLADKKRKKYNVWDVDNSNLDKGFGFVGNWKWGT